MTDPEIKVITVNLVVQNGAIVSGRKQSSSAFGNEVFRPFVGLLETSKSYAFNRSLEELNSQFDVAAVYGQNAIIQIPFASIGIQGQAYGAYRCLMLVLTAFIKASRSCG